MTVYDRVRRGGETVRGGRPLIRPEAEGRDVAPAKSPPERIRPSPYRRDGQCVLVERRITVIGLLLVSAGVFLTLVPVAPAATSSDSIPPGTWIGVAVPWTISADVASVEIALQWGSQPSYGGVLHSTTASSYLIVCDCGTSSCTSSANYSVVGRTGSEQQGFALVWVVPGHHYQVWAFRAHTWLTNWNSSVPVSAVVREPPVAGALGLSVVGVGAVATVHSIRPLRLPRRGNAG